LIVTAQLPHCQAASGALAKRYAVGQRLINAALRYTVCLRLAIFGGLDAPTAVGYADQAGFRLSGVRGGETPSQNGAERRFLLFLIHIETMGFCQIRLNPLQQ